VVPMQPLISTIGTALGADTAWLAEATPFVTVHLAQNEFTPSPGMSLIDLVESTFGGYAALHAGSAATQVFIDPATTAQVVQVVEPLGGWHFSCTSLPAGPQPCTGYYLTDAASTKLIAVERFPETIVLAAVGSAIDIDQVRFEVVVNPLM